MTLYAGEILSMHESHIIKYNLFETRKDALSWCMDNANFRTRAPDGNPRSLAAYDKNRYGNVDFYSDDRCKMGFFLWGYFAVRTIDV